MTWKQNLVLDDKKYKTFWNSSFDCAPYTYAIPLSPSLTTANLSNFSKIRFLGNHIKFLILTNISQLCFPLFLSFMPPHFPLLPPSIPPPSLLKFQIGSARHLVILETCRNLKLLSYWDWKIQRESTYLFSWNANHHYLYKRLVFRTKTWTMNLKQNEIDPSKSSLPPIKECKQASFWIR